MTLNQLQFPSKFHFHCQSNPQEAATAGGCFGNSIQLFPQRGSSSLVMIQVPASLCAAIANSKLWNSMSWASSCLPTMSTSGTPSSVSLGVLLFAVSLPVPDRPQTMRDLRGHGYTRTLQAAQFTSDRIRYSNNVPRTP